MTDEEIRRAALKAAARVHSEKGVFHDSTVINTARKFEQYIRTGR